jgi:phospholipid-translocating ATPase
VGQLIKVHKDEFFPADLVLVNSSEINGICYVETKNLDGETNLKFKSSIAGIQELTKTDEDVIRNVRGSIECESPNDRIY